MRSAVGASGTAAAVAAALPRALPWCGFVAAVALAASARAACMCPGCMRRDPRRGSASRRLRLRAAGDTAAVLQGNGRWAPRRCPCRQGAGGIAAAGALYVTRRASWELALGRSPRRRPPRRWAGHWLRRCPMGARGGVLAVSVDDDDECAAEAPGSDGRETSAPPAPLARFAQIAADGADMLVRSAMLKLSFVRTGRAVARRGGLRRAHVSRCG